MLRGIIVCTQGKAGGGGDSGEVSEADEVDEQGVPTLRLRRASSGCVLDAPGQVQVRDTHTCTCMHMRVHARTCTP